MPGCALMYSMNDICVMARLIAKGIQPANQVFFISVDISFYDYIISYHVIMVYFHLFKNLL